MPALTDHVVAIKLSDEERDSGVLTDLHLFDAIEAFFQDGIVVVENAVEHSVLDRLNERMRLDTERCLRGEGAVYYR